jgi:hypothetical protein
MSLVIVLFHIHCLVPNHLLPLHHFGINLAFIVYEHKFDILYILNKPHQNLINGWRGTSDLKHFIDLMHFPGPPKLHWYSSSKLILLAEDWIGIYWNRRLASDISTACQAVYARTDFALCSQLAVNPKIKPAFHSQHAVDPKNILFYPRGKWPPSKLATIAILHQQWQSLNASWIGWKSI